MDSIAIDASRIFLSDRGDGDFSKSAEAIDDRRSSLIDREWSWLRQVHGGDVVVESKPGEYNGAEADAIVSSHPDSVLSIATADCLAIGLVGDNGVIGAAHAGWRGLVAGVIQNTVTEMRKLGSNQIKVVCGPCIGPECYEFDVTKLQELSKEFGRAIVGETSWKTPALNLRKLRDVLTERAEVEVIHDEDACTACDADEYFSFRARNESQRMVMAVTRD